MNLHSHSNLRQPPLPHNHARYDAAGNPMASGTGNYVYNAEHEMTSATVGGTTTTYSYDGDSKRVEKSGGKIYWYGGGSDGLVETDLSGNTNNATFSEYVFFAGKRISRRDYQSNVFYYFADHLGTSREMFQAGQTSACYDADFYPYGGEIVHTNSCATSQNYKFTAKERDTESDLDNFGARYMTSSFGRFMSPDNPFTDQDRMNPQSWNLYGYVRNNPLRGIDPSGRGAKEFAEAVRNIVVLTFSSELGFGVKAAILPLKFEAKSGITTETKVRPFGNKESETTTYVDSYVKGHAGPLAYQAGTQTPFIDPKTGAIYGKTQTETVIKGGAEKGETVTASGPGFSNDHEIHVLAFGFSVSAVGGSADLSLDTNEMSTAAKELPGALLEGGEAILNMLSGLNPFAQEQSKPDIRSPLTCPTQPCQSQ